jgi:hypothetical protein
MDGLLVIGADVSGAHPLLDVERGSPLTAAAHRGEHLDPEALVDAARARGGVLSAGAGLLSPITPRYTVRDLAHELGLPVVLAIEARDDLVDRARLALLAAHAGGLSVAAVALVGWPETPSRLVLDERTLLGEVAGVPVVADPPWPTAEWSGAARPRGVAVVLEPYTPWAPSGEEVDPREAGRKRLMEALMAIVGAEGPVLASRAFGLYNKAAGGKKLTTIARAPLSGATYWLATEGHLVLTKRDEIPWQDDEILRLPDTPAVRVRELGPRTLDEVPLDEIAELMRRLDEDDPVVLKRKVLETYGLRRLTSKADEYLGTAIDLR